LHQHQALCFPSFYRQSEGPFNKALLTWNRRGKIMKAPNESESAKKHMSETWSRVRRRATNVENVSGGHQNVGCGGDSRMGKLAAGADYTDKLFNDNR